jgi:hypothetical protein
VVKVKVPSDFTGVSRYCLELRTTQPEFIALAGLQCVGAQQPVEVPLGGRRKFAAYRASTDATRIYLVPEPDPDASVDPQDPRCRRTATTPAAPQPQGAPIPGVAHLQKVKPTEVDFALLVAPTKPNAFDPGGALMAVPLVTVERNRCDPDQDLATGKGVFYLRGVRLPSANEAATVLAATMLSAGPFDPPRRVTTQIKVRVRRESLGRSRPVVDDVVVEASNKTGVPPQFLKAQAKKETKFRADRYRYEPITIDFYALSSDGAPDRGRPHVQRHLLTGNAVSATDDSRCVAIVGPSTTPTTTCREVAAGTSQLVFIEEDPTTVFVRARSGRIVSAGYRTGHPEARREWAPASQPAPPAPAGVVSSLTYREPALWTLAAGHQPMAALGDLDFSFDYRTNSVILGRALRPGEWIRLDYKVLQPDPIAAQGCSSVPGGVATFNGKSQPLPPRGSQQISFVDNDSIRRWLDRNIQRRGGYAWLNGTESESRIEFTYDAAAGKPTGSPIDRRLDLATAQFVAAASFGLTQATTSLWTQVGTGGQAILNKAFDINARCLWELMTGPSPAREQDAANLAAAAHSFFRQQIGPLAATADQIDWAQHWSRVIQNYNASGPKYCRYWRMVTVIIKGKPSKRVMCSSVPVGGGMSQLVLEGLREHCPGCRRTP